MLCDRMAVPLAGAFIHLGFALILAGVQAAADVLGTGPGIECCHFEFGAALFISLVVGRRLAVAGCCLASRGSVRTRSILGRLCLVVGAAERAACENTADGGCGKSVKVA